MKIYIFNAYEMILPSSSHDDFMILHHTTTVIQVGFPSWNLYWKIDAFFHTQMFL